MYTTWAIDAIFIIQFYNQYIRIDFCSIRVTPTHAYGTTENFSIESFSKR